MNATASKIERKLGDVISVYSGKDGKCCCGCAGKHYDASWSNAKRDHRTTSDKMVKKVFSLVENHLNADDKVETYGFKSSVVGGRIYIVYFKKK